MQSLNDVTSPENVDENVASRDFTNNEVEALPEEEEVLNPPVAQDEESIEKEVQSQTTSNPEEQPMINGNSAPSNCD